MKKKMAEMKALEELAKKQQQDAAWELSFFFSFFVFWAPFPTRFCVRRRVLKKEEEEEEETRRKSLRVEVKRAREREKAEMCV